jgi:hypothetical protein
MIFPKIEFFEIQESCYLKSKHFLWGFAKSSQSLSSKQFAKSGVLFFENNPAIYLSA